MARNEEQQNQNQDNAGNGEGGQEQAARPEIIRGRMPVAVVALARFGSVKDLTTREAADKLGTTVGKVDDIRKNRNFAYVGEDFRPTAQQKADGVAWLKRHPSGAAELIAELEAVPEATEEQAAAFDAARSAARGQSNKTAEGEEANAGGGNRRRGKKKDTEVSGDQLTS